MWASLAVASGRHCAWAQYLWRMGLVALWRVGLGSLARDRTCIPDIGRLIRTPWATREVPDTADLVLELHPSWLWGPHVLLASHLPPDAPSPAFFAASSSSA